MTVEVLFFGIVKDIVGSSRDVVDLEPGATLDTLFAQYAARFPKLAGMRGSVLLAANQEFAPRTRPLADGDEVAFLPPVSGGTLWSQRIETSEGHFFGLTREKLNPPELAARLLRGEDGAVATFEGVVRNNSKGRSTKYLDYECYEPMAIRMLEEIGRGIANRHSIGRIGMVHRTGRLQIGEASVAVVVTSPHRQAAFDACLEGINRLKKSVPIWKKEYFADGEVWVEGEWDDSILSR